MKTITIKTIFVAVILLFCTKSYGSTNLVEEEFIGCVENSMQCKNMCMNNKMYAGISMIKNLTLCPSIEKPEACYCLKINKELRGK